VLVDGGVGFPVPQGTDVDAVLTAVIGPAMTRLSMTFPDRDAYLGFMSRNPAVAEVIALDPAAAGYFAGYLDHDLVSSLGRCDIDLVGARGSVDPVGSRHGSRPVELGGLALRGVELVGRSRHSRPRRSSTGCAAQPNS
jgi:hypothetical protein